MVWKKKAKTSNKKRTPKIVDIKDCKPQIVHKGLELDSNGELYFCYWMDELIEKGYIRKYERGKSYLLTDSLYNNYVQQLKTKSKPKVEVVMQGHSYSNDFDIFWEDKAKGLFFNNFGEKWTCFFLSKPIFNMSFVECKPEFDFKNMTRTSINSVKYLHERHGIFCQITKNEELFKQTFVPKLALKTKTGKMKIWKFKKRSLEEYEKSCGK